MDFGQGGTQVDERAQLREQLQATLGADYVIGRELGGAMSRVFVMDDVRLGRQVVVKVLHPELAEGVSALRFQREIQLVARLQHPHVVPLIAAGHVGGLPFYTMPYVEGESLRGRLAREGRLPVSDVVRLLRQLADALGYAHDEGIVHRDLKPENVLLSRGHALISDFGVAKAFASAHRVPSGDGQPTHHPTEYGIAIGTPAYMAPEQAAGDPATDHRADLYALGVIAWELLAGAHPFGARPPQQLLAAHLTEVPPPVTARRPEVPRALSRLVARLLAKLPADRPQSAGDVLALLEDVPTSGERAALALPTRAAWARTRWMRPALWTGAAMVAAGLAAGAWWRQRPQPERAATPRRVLVVPFENATGDASLAPLGQMAADWVAQGVAQTGVVEVSSELPRPAAPGESGLRAAAREHDAGTVVAGRYYVDGDSVRLQVRLVDAAGWTLLRAVPPLAAPRAAPQQLLEPLRQRVMAVLAVTHDPRFAGWEMGTPPPTYAAYEAYVAGLDRFRNGEWRAALPHWERAAALDSTYVQPLLSSINAYLNLGEDATADSLARALERRRHALTPFDRAMLDRQRGTLDGDRGAALAGARAAAAAAPGAPIPQFLYGQAAMRMNRPREALAALARVSPAFRQSRIPWSSQGYWRAVADAHHMLGEYGEELAATAAARELLPGNALVLAAELRAHGARGDAAGVRRTLGDLEVSAPTPGTPPFPALLREAAEELAAHGMDEEARAVLARAAAWQRARPAPEQQTPAARYALARALVGTGELAEAERLVARLAAEQPDDPRYVLQQGLVALRRGRPDDARDAAGRLQTMRRPYDRGRTTYFRAQLAAQLGDTGGALALLRQALGEGLGFGPGLHADQELAPLRRDPAFRELLTPRG